MLIKEITSYKEFQDYITNNKFLIINISASWCKPCTFIKPLVENYVKSITNTDYIYLKIDFSFYEAEEDDFNKILKGNKIPYFAIMQEGNIVESIISSDFVYVYKIISNHISINNFDKDADF